MTEYTVDKQTGTSADTLLAAGFARLASEILRAAGKRTDELRIVDSGSHYRVILPEPIEEADLEQFEASSLVLHLDTATQEKALGQHYGHGFPYDAQRQIRDEYREKRKALPPEARGPDARLAAHPALEQLALSVREPDTLLPLYLIINQMKVAPSFNDPVLRWRELSPELLREHIRLLLDLFATQPNPLEATVTRWRQLSKEHNLGDAEMTLLQVINPTTGKGANRTKANALTIGGQEGFWLLELLKFAGFFTLAHPQTISNSKDRKTYVLRPRAIRLSMLDEVMRTFRDVLWSNTPAKLDIMAVLQLTRVLVSRERQALEREEPQRPRRPARRPAERVHGFDVTFYKDMGSAHAVMNVAALNLPEWLPAIETAHDARRIESILREHVDVVGAIRAQDGAERTEEYELLRRYRDFLSGRTIEPFLDFAALFAPYLSRKIERGEYTQRFSIETLKELFSMTRQDFRPVIESEGFQNIAAAIRRSTVTLQYAKGRGERVNFDIRYGLAQDLVRHSNYPDEFMNALSEFVLRYNNETAQTYETSKGEKRRPRVTDEDLAEIINLMAQGYSSKTLARLLVAFGSAKIKSDPPEPKVADTQQDLSAQG